MYVLETSTSRQEGLRHAHGLTGVAKEAARIVPDATMTLATGRNSLPHALRRLRLQRVSTGAGCLPPSQVVVPRFSNDGLASIGQALAQCSVNGYTMVAKTSYAIVVDQAGLDVNQQASTDATAAVHSMHNCDGMMSTMTALRDLRGGADALKSSPHATLMVVMYAEHAAYTALQTKP